MILSIRPFFGCAWRD